MTKAIETLLRDAEVLGATPVSPGTMSALYDVAFIVELARDVGELQKQHATQKDNIRKILADLATIAKERDELRDALARKTFEVTVLQMTQGALKMEIDRLRSEPRVAALNATVIVDPLGNITISAPEIAITGNVEVN